MDDNYDNQLVSASQRLMLEMLADVSKLYGSKEVVASVREAAEIDGTGDENFDGWLPLRLAGSNKYYDYTLQELKTIRDAVRTLCDVNELAKNIIKHYKNFIVGKGIQLTILPEDLGDDPVAIADVKDDAQMRKMRENWKLFTEANNFTSRLHEWVERKHRDGEAVIRIFKTKNVPVIRFVEPNFIESSDTDAPYGVIVDENDAETLEFVVYKNPETSEEVDIKATDIIYDKVNVDRAAPRGIPSFWPCMTNFRRAEKLLINSSVLATVQAAITMIRRHETASQAKVERLIRSTADGINRTDTSTGRPIYARKVRPGTVLDAPKGIAYDFPSHSVDPSRFIAVATNELSRIAANFVLPVEWLLADEPTEPLTPGSPVVANFEREQTELFTHIVSLFWNIQGRMGINVEKNRLKYNIFINGRRLAVGKALDEARVDEILLRNGATSPQGIAAKHGIQYATARANVIKHRRTAQPGEAMPGDRGNTNPAQMQDNGGDGTTTSTQGQRLNDGDGGKQ